MLVILEEMPLSKNQYTNLHWSKRKIYKARILELIKSWKEFEDDIGTESYDELPYEKAKLSITIYFKTHRKRDVQNYLGGGLISWIDCLVDVGYIKDDCYDVIGQPFISFEVDKECPRTEILIEKEKQHVRINKKTKDKK